MDEWVLCVDDKWISADKRKKLWISGIVYALLMSAIIAINFSMGTPNRQTLLVILAIVTGSACIIFGKIVYSEYQIKQNWNITIADGVIECFFGGITKAKIFQFNEGNPLQIKKDLKGKYWIISAGYNKKNLIKVPIKAYPNLLGFIEEVEEGIGKGNIQRVAEVI